MITKQEKRKISVDMIVRLCVGGFLDVMKKGDDFVKIVEGEEKIVRTPGQHHEPFEAVAGTLEDDLGIGGEAAYSVLRPVYWTLMKEGILEHCQGRLNGTYWKQVRDVSVDGAVKMVYDRYEKDMRERVNGLNHTE